jgi:hypothetical protein
VYFLRCRVCLCPRLAVRGWPLTSTASHLTQYSLQESKNQTNGKQKCVHTFQNHIAWWSIQGTQ